MPHVDNLIMEMLANHTHPTCIQKNILAVARLINPNLNIVYELPCLNHIRNMRTVLASTSKTIATLRLARAQVWKQLHTDETSRRNNSLANVVIGMLDSDGALNSICLSCSIIANDGTAEEQAFAIISLFQEFKQLLDDWREVTLGNYPNRPDLHKQIPPSTSMCRSKLLGGMLSTDTCPTALLIFPTLIQNINR